VPNKILRIELKTVVTRYEISRQLQQFSFEALEIQMLLHLPEILNPSTGYFHPLLELIMGSHSVEESFRPS